MTQLIKKYIFKNKAGSFLVEMSVALPIVMVIAFAGVEMTQMVQVRQNLASLARDTSNTIKRICASRFEGDELDNCVERVVKDYNAGAKRMFKDFDDKGFIVASVFKKTIVDGIASSKRESIRSTKNNSFVGQTRYSASPGSNDADGVSMSELFEYSTNLAVAEVFYQRATLTPLYKIADNIAESDGWQYDTAIF